MEIKTITIEAMGLSWFIALYVVKGNDSSDPQISEHTYIDSWDLVEVFYNDGWLTFPPSTLEFLLSEHYDELNEIVKIEGLS